MGNPTGVLAGMLVVIVLAIATFVSPHVGITTALFAAYGLFGAAWTYDNATQPRDFTHVQWLMSPREVALYTKFHLAIDRIEVATFISSGLNVVRIFGLILAGIAFWQLRIGAGISFVIYFVLCGSLVVRLNPYFYVFAGASEGDRRLGEMADFLARIATNEDMRRQNT